jgi:hypothetical protein
MTSDAVRFWALGLQTALDNFGAVIREWLFEDENGCLRMKLANMEEKNALQ